MFCELRATLRAVASVPILAGLVLGQTHSDSFRRADSEKFCVVVSDPQGFRAASVSVFLEPMAAAPVRRGMTGEDGQWCAELPPGVYVLRAVGRGMEGASGWITVGAGGSSREVALQLRISSVASQVEVTASRLPESLVESPLPVTQIDARQLEKIGARQLNDALQEQPEIVSFAGGSHSGGGSTNLQGFGSRDVEILVDGQPLTGRVSGYVDLNQFDSSFIEAVEVKAGASAMTYGLQGMGGAINLVTRRAAAGTHGAVESGYGSFNTGLLRADGGFTKGGFAVYSAAAMHRGLGYELAPSTLAKTQPPSRVRNLFASVYLPTWRNWNAGLTALFLDQNFWGVDGTEVTGIYDFRRPKRRLLWLPRASYTLSSNTLLSLRGRRFYYRADEDLVYRSPVSVRAQKTENEAQGLDAELSLAKPGGFRLLAGGFFNHLSMVGDRLTTTGSRASTGVWSQLTTAELPLWNGLRLLGGYRADRDRIFGSRFSPQAALSWRPLGWLSVSGGVTRGIRAPDFNELYIFHTHAGGRVRIYGEPTLRPQECWSYHAGLLIRANSRTRLEARMFHHDMTSLIQTRFIGIQGAASVYRYANIGRARIRGASASLIYTPSRRLELLAGYQYLDTLNRDASTVLEYAPRHRGNFRVTWNDAQHGLLASFFGNANSTTYLGLSGGTRLYMEAFELLGINLQKNLTPRIAARATFRNLTDNVDPAYRLTAPFSAEVSLRFRLGRVED